MKHCNDSTAHTPETELVMHTTCFLLRGCHLKMYGQFNQFNQKRIGFYRIDQNRVAGVAQAALDEKFGLGRKF